jgi:hypothetical protein
MLPSDVAVTLMEHVPADERAQVEDENAPLPEPPVCAQLIVSPATEK